MPTVEGQMGVLSGLSQGTQAITNLYSAMSQAKFLKEKLAQDKELRGAEIEAARELQEKRLAHEEKLWGTLDAKTAAAIKSQERMAKADQDLRAEAIRLQDLQNQRATTLGMNQLSLEYAKQQQEKLNTFLNLPYIDAQNYPQWLGLADQMFPNDPATAGFAKASLRAKLDPMSGLDGTTRALADAMGRGDMNTVQSIAMRLGAKNPEALQAELYSMLTVASARLQEANAQLGQVAYLTGTTPNFYTIPSPQQIEEMSYRGARLTPPSAGSNVPTDRQNQIRKDLGLGRTGLGQITQLPPGYRLPDAQTQARTPEANEGSEDSVWSGMSRKREDEEKEKEDERKKALQKRFERSQPVNPNPFVR